MEQINWIKCNERMPHDYMDDVIAKADLHDDAPFITDGYTMNNSTTDWHEWTPYTEATWKELQNDTP